MNPTLTLSCGEYIRTKPLLDGRVRPEENALEVVPDPFPARGLLADYQHARNQRMIVERAFEICEMGMAPYLSARAAGVPLIAIPVFHYRRFRHSYIFCREGAGIKHPEDLLGRRVGVRRLNLSAGLWARGLLQHDYGVPLERITWVVALDVPLRPEVRDKLKVEIAPAHETLQALLLRGELDVMIEAFAEPLMMAHGSGIYRLLGEDTRQLEVDYYARTGIFPIMHTVVLWQETASRFPELPRRLHQAFVEAKAVGARDPKIPLRYVLAEEERQWWDSLTEAQRQLMQGGKDGPRDPWVYSVREDRKTVETFLDYAYEQGLIPERYQIEDLFVDSTLDL